LKTHRRREKVMKKFLAVILAVFAVSLFAATFSISYTGWYEQGFEFLSDGTLTYASYGEISFGGFYPSSTGSATDTMVNFTFAISGINLFTSPTTWDNTGAYVSTAYVAFKPITGFTLSVGKRTYRSVYYDNVWEDNVYSDISSNRLTAQYVMQPVTVTVGAFSQDTFLATDVRVLAQVNYDPIYAAVSYDVKTGTLPIYARLNYDLGSVGLEGFSVAADVRYETKAATVTDGAVSVSGAVASAEFGAGLNYYKFILGSPAEFKVWFNYPIAPVTLKTYFESDTGFSSIYASVAAPYDMKNVVVTPKIEFDEGGFDKASLKFSYSF